MPPRAKRGRFGVRENQIELDGHLCGLRLVFSRAVNVEQSSAGAGARGACYLPHKLDSIALLNVQLRVGMQQERIGKTRLCKRRRRRQGKFRKGKSMRHCGKEHGHGGADIEGGTFRLVRGIRVGHYAPILRICFDLKRLHRTDFPAGPLPHIPFHPQIMPPVRSFTASAAFALCRPLCRSRISPYSVDAELGVLSRARREGCRNGTSMISVSELAHNGVVGSEGAEGALLDLDADVGDARVDRGVEPAVCGGRDAQPVASRKLDILAVDRG